MARLDDLTSLRDGLIERMESCESDQNYAVLGRLLRDIVRDIEEIAGAPAGSAKETGLSDFEKRLRDRESSAKVPRRTKSG